MPDSDRGNGFAAWLKSYWFFSSLFVAGLIGTAIILLTLQPREPEPATQEWIEQEGAAYYPGGPDCRPDALGGLTGPQARVQTNHCAEEAEQHRHNENDLIQQRRMAESAETANQLTYTQARTQSFEAATILWAFLAAVAAAYYAWQASQTAKDELDLTRESLQPQIGVEYAGILEPRKMLPDGERVGVRISIKNYGRSTARQFVGLLNVRTGSPHGEPPRIESIEGWTQMPLESGATKLYTGYIELKSAQVERIKSGSLTLWATCRVEYVDNSGNSQVGIFRFGCDRERWEDRTFYDK